jgi:transglutaminase-like putative cysteine protease
MGRIDPAACCLRPGRRVTGSNIHAWVQAYIPGPGWIDFDPSSGLVGNQNLVRVAVVREPGEAIGCKTRGSERRKIISR